MYTLWGLILVSTESPTGSLIPLPIIHGHFYDSKAKSQIFTIWPSTEKSANPWPMSESKVLLNQR